MLKNIIILLFLAWIVFESQACEVTNDLKTKEFIKKINPKANAKLIDHYVNYYSEKYKIKKEIGLAILATESSFRNIKSNTNDLGMSQINTIWIKEFKRLKIPFDYYKLNDPKYSIKTLFLILSILKKTHPNEYFLIYHSKTPKYKNLYRQKIDSKLQMIFYLNNTGKTCNIYDHIKKGLHL